MELQRMNQPHAVEVLVNIIENNPAGFQQILDAAHVLVIKRRNILEKQKQKYKQQKQYDLDMIKSGFRLPPPPNWSGDQLTEPLHMRAQEARKWGKRIKLRKETTLAMKELKLPLAAIINIVDFI